MTFDEWRNSYQYEIGSPITNIEAAWNAAVEASAKANDAFAECDCPSEGGAGAEDPRGHKISCPYRIVKQGSAAIRALSTDKAESAKASQ